MGDVTFADALTADELNSSVAAQATGFPVDAGADGSQPEAPAGKWYVVHTYSGYEDKVKKDLANTIKNRHMEDLIFEVMVPTQNVTEITPTGRKTVKRKLYPGYVLINMIHNNDTWYVVRNTRGVTGFVGPSGEPLPLTENEMKPFGLKTSNISVDFGEGDTIAVVSGAWINTFGVVQKLDYNKHTVIINMEMFGRETPVELSFSDVRKL